MEHGLGRNWYIISDTMLVTVLVAGGLRLQVHLHVTAARPGQGPTGHWQAQERPSPGRARASYPDAPALAAAWPAPPSLLDCQPGPRVMLCESQQGHVPGRHLKGGPPAGPGQLIPSPKCIQL